MPTRKKAIEAVEKILEARAKHGLEALDTAWENNDVLLVELREAGYGDEADGLEGVYRELRMALTPPVEDSAPVGPEIVEPPSDQDRVMAEDNAEQTADTEPEEPPLTDMPEAAMPEEEAEPAPEPEAELIPPPSPSRQSRDRHDPFWDGRSLAITPPPGKGKGVLDWKLWPVLVQQRIRQAWTKETIDTLYLHNEQNFLSYAQARGERDSVELKAEFDAARLGLPFAADLT